MNKRALSTKLLDFISKSSEASPLKISVGQQGQRINCVYCRESLGQDTVLCLRCRTALHSECRDELDGKCPILGCVGVIEDKRDLADAVEGEVKGKPDPARNRVNFEFPIWLPLLIFFSVLGSICSAILMLSIQFRDALEIGVLSTFIICTMLFYQNFRQSKALETPVQPQSERLESYKDGLVALSGPMESDYDPLVTPHDNECLWYKQITQRYSRRRGQNARAVYRWRDVKENCGEYCRPFRIGEVTISNEITEPSGYKEIVRYIERKDGKSTTAGDVREIIQFLEAGTEVTVVGRLFKEGKDWVLKRDMTGLILTTKPRVIYENARRNMVLSMTFPFIYSVFFYFWLF